MMLYFHIPSLHITDQTSLTPINLAVASKQEGILDVLLDYCLGKYFDISMILLRLVILK